MSDLKSSDNHHFKRNPRWSVNCLKAVSQTISDEADFRKEICTCKRDEKKKKSIIDSLTEHDIRKKPKMLICCTTAQQTNSTQTHSQSNIPHIDLKDPFFIWWKQKLFLHLQSWWLQTSWLLQPEFWDVMKKTTNSAPNLPVTKGCSSWSYSETCPDFVTNCPRNSGSLQSCFSQKQDALIVCSTLDLGLEHRQLCCLCHRVSHCHQYTPRVLATRQIHTIHN